MSENMKLWNALRTPPEGAMKSIKGGRMQGKLDINPQWRLRAMTEQFGPCGLGWRYTIEKLWTVPVGEGGEVAAFAELNVYIKEGDAWSAPIPGIGGNMLVVREKGGPHINDDCFKMAVTDALSVAFKALGVAADVYMGFLDSKYDQRGGNAGGGGGRPKRQPKDEGLGKCPDCGTFMRKQKRRDGKGSFLSCQAYPECKHSAPLPKDEKPKPEAAPPPGRVVEEICPVCGDEPMSPDGICRKGKDPQPQEVPPQEGPPRCCDRNMMPRPGPGGAPPLWQCPKCRKTLVMNEAERKRVGL